MRTGIAAFALLATSLFASPSHADPYLWCAVYGDGSQTCLFKTLEDCRDATVVGGACTPNLNYNRRDAAYGRRHNAMRY
jgi:hypothetical protein